MIKYSVIGTSWITKSFIEGASLVKDLVLDGVYSRSYEKGCAFAQENGALRAFAAFEELLISDTDLVYVASPNVCHYSQCKALLENGKHVICEKPVTVTAQEFSELCDLAKAKKLVYFEAIMYMHTPNRTALRQAVANIGEIHNANIDFSQLSSKYPALVRGELPNIFNPKMATGALNDLGIYCVYPVVDLFGMPDEILPYQRFLDTGADSGGNATFVYGDKFVTITYSKIAQSRSHSQIMGDKGTVTIGSISQTDDIWLYDNQGNGTCIVEKQHKKQLMANEAQSAVNFILHPEKYGEFLDRCRDINLRVLECMEKMRVSNA